MLRFSFWISGAVVLTAALWLTGCGSENGHDGNGDGVDQSSHDQGNGGDSDLEANLAKLSPEDRALVEKQKTCPVTGDLLGEMAVPIKLEIDGKTVFICCAGCEEDARKLNAD